MVFQLQRQSNSGGIAGDNMPGFGQFTAPFIKIKYLNQHWIYGTDMQIHELYDIIIHPCANLEVKLTLYLLQKSTYINTVYAKM